MAATGQRLFSKHVVALLATVVKDGRPRRHIPEDAGDPGILAITWIPYLASLVWNDIGV